MCGIAGIYGSVEAAARKKGLNILAGCLAHRGPDGGGEYEDETISLAHARLSIIDLSSNGDQPQYNEDKSVVLICNGEIYNYKKLRSDLQAKGHTFSSHSDCEVILHLYEEHRNEPAKLLERLTGMFAFALWDSRLKRLFIARDRVGIKPLYYSFVNGALLFASEVKPIAATGLAGTETDITSLYEFFLLGSIPGPNTLYKTIKCLPPGHYLTMTGGQMEIEEYWDIPVIKRKWKDEQEVVDETEKLLSEIIKDHLVADVPVGTFLSAGIDSSLISAIAVGHHPGIHSFTAAFPGEPEDEGVIAADTARKLGTTHHAYEMKNDFFKDFTSQLKDIDQPFAPNSALSLGRISKMARQEVKVVLSGDGGDELFGGYARYEQPKRPDFLKYIPGAMQSGMLGLLARATGKQSLESLRQNLKSSEAVSFFWRIIIADPQTVIKLFSAGTAAKIDKERYLNHLESLFAKRKDDDKLNRVLYVDMKTALVDEMLTKCDRMTMINGIEGRVPLLDHRMVALAFSIPGEYKRKNGTGKIILRKILARKLGNELAFRIKTGFNSPLKQWLSRDEATSLFVKQELKQAARLPYLNSATIKSFEQAPDKFDSVLVYSLVCLNEYMQLESTHTNGQLPK
jgi:asparagine synthase (glutamine-hydrolysing)